MAICESPPPVAAPKKQARRGLTLAAWNQLRQSLRRETLETRPWLVSLVVHAVMLLVLACLVFDRQGHLGDEAIWALFDDGGEDRVTLTSEVPDIQMLIKPDEVKAEPASAPLPVLDPDLMAAREPREDLALNRVPVPQSKIPAKSTPEEQPRKSTASPQKGKGPGKAEWLSKGARALTAGRTGAAKGNLLRQFGGTPKTEAAVDKGLRWLLKQQAYDGGWYLSGPYADGMLTAENRVAATSMAILAFLGAGHTHQQGDHQRQVNQALQWLIAHQKTKSGFFGTDTPMHHGIYTQAQATLVLCEAFAMTQDPSLMQPAQSALNYCVKAQGDQGGWRYEFRGDSDTSVTGWMMMALVSGKAAGLEVPEKTFKGVRNYMDTVSHDDGETYSYMQGRPPTPSMTAEGLLCRMYLGWPRTNAAIDGGTARLMGIAPFRIEDQAYYYWYYATQVLHHAGGQAWEDWNLVMREQLPTAQVDEGPEAGSWSPLGNRHDRAAGRLYTTCMAIYCLEVYYRHMPIYESPWSEAPPDS